MGEHYKGNIIDTKAYERADGKGWKYEFYIYREHGSYGAVTRFFSETTYSTQEEAVKAALAAAKQKVDQGYDDSGAVEDLPTPDKGVTKV